MCIRDSIIIAHSIGCYMTLQVLKQFQKENILNRIEKCLFLFPAIENLSQTPNGKKNLMYKIVPAALISLLIQGLSMLPNFIQRLFITLAIGRQQDENMVKGIQFLMDYRRMFNFLRMANSEMLTVKELDPELIKDTANICYYYFGKNDGWFPQSYVKKYDKQIQRVRV
eukprot:TRINITY_DN1850_c0_g1_i5.p2 TRINITY_DN1850_c0_g1~~TRINITY_DN1850_c0_g1_i5.p2  ORF type:complete len:169 (-),score=25.43 TRINITY_DN1850_c0_g1_i5:133-639(-)